MDKYIERFIKQVQDISDIVIKFQSEPVQIRIVEFLLPFVEPKGKQTKNSPERNEFGVASKKKSSNSRFKKPGVKIVLDQVLLTDFFNKERTIAEIVEHLNQDGNKFKATDVSGILLAFVKKGRLIRSNNPLNNRFLYKKP